LDLPATEARYEFVVAGSQGPAPFLHAFLSEIGMESPDFHCHKTPLAKIAAPSVGKDRPVFHIPPEGCYERFNLVGKFSVFHIKSAIRRQNRFNRRESRFNRRENHFNQRVSCGLSE